MVLVGQEVQAIVDSASDLNLIRKDIANKLHLQPAFLARAATQVGGSPLKTYSVFHERLQIEDSFGAQFDACKPFTSDDIEVPLILGLPWLQRYNLILNFDPMSIQWRDSSSTVTDSLGEPLDLESLSPFHADF